MKMKALMVAGACGLLSVGIANAASVSYSDSISQTTTDWVDAMDFPLFDSNLGVLTSVKIELEGEIVSAFRFESLDAMAATIKSEIDGSIKIQRPDNSDLVEVLPANATSDNVTAFDGSIDFGGGSGRTLLPLSANAMDMFTTSAPGDLALFTGVGNISLPVLAQATSLSTGAGNLVTFISTSAGAEGKITYNYRAQEVPLPAAAWGGLAILGGLGVRRFRKLRQD